MNNRTATALSLLTIADSGNARLAAQVVLGQYDTLPLTCHASAWSQLATSDN